MGGATRKQYLTLGGFPLLALSLQVLQRLGSIREIILAVPQQDRDYCWSEIIKPYGLSKVSHVVAGGARRQDSVRNGLMAISTPPDLVLVHDGVRPFLQSDFVEQSISCAKGHWGSRCCDAYARHGEAGQSARGHSRDIESVKGCGLFRLHKSFGMIG